MFSCNRIGNKCSALYYCTKEGDSIGKKKLKQGCYYCLGVPRIKKLGHAASWSGSAPKWCPKRQIKEEE